MMDRLKVDAEAITFFHQNFLTISHTQLEILRGFLEYALGRRWLNSQTLVVALLQVFKLHNCVIFESLYDVVFYNFNWWQNLCKKFFPDVSMLGQVVDQICRRDLNGLHTSKEKGYDLIDDQVVITSEELCCRQNCEQVIFLSLR